MALSDTERYTLKLKALNMIYNDGYALTDVASTLNISRVTLNRLLEEAKKEGMLHVEIVDVRNSGKDFSIEMELCRTFNLKNVILTNCAGLDEENTNYKIAKSAASIFDRLVKDNMNIGVTWGRTLKTMATLISERQSFNGIIVNSLVGTTCDSTISFQPSIIAQILADKLHGSIKIVTAPFLCSSVELTKLIKQETQIKEVLSSVTTNDINIVGIGRSPQHNMKILNGMPFTPKIIEELYEAGAVGDIGGNFYDINGNTCQTDINNRIVTIDLKSLKEHKTVIGVGGGKGKEKAVLGALRGGLVDILVTDSKTAVKVLDLVNG